MNRTRLEAFSDGVIAIIITIMVLELHAPHTSSARVLSLADLQSLRGLWPVFVSYILSYVYVGIYWTNHHHMLHTVRRVTGSILWANLHLLFWLSLVPFVTAWIGQNHFAPTPMAVYGFVLLMAAIAYTILQHTIIADQGPNSVLRAAVKADWKGKVSVACYLVGILCCLVSAWIAGVLYVTVAMLWLIPDRRIEHEIRRHEPSTEAEVK